MASIKSYNLLGDSGLIIRDISHQNSYDFHSIHRHEYFEFMLFDHGEGGKQTIDFKDYEIVDRALYIIVPNQVHLMHRNPSEDGLLVQFSKEFLLQAISPFQVDWIYQLSVAPQIRLGEGQYQNLRGLLLHLRAELEEDGPYKSQRVKHLFGFLFFEILGAIPTEINVGRKESGALAFLMLAEERFRDLKTVQAYAQAMGISVGKLTAEVKKQFGKSPLKVIHDLILLEIKRLLVAEQLSHKEIAFELNFDSQSSYSRFIKQMTSLTPSQLKEQITEIAQE